MARFSDDLRGERQRLGVSLDTISEVTRIHMRHLLALEAGDFDQLPGGVFRHGILRNYLSVLGLDASPWVERFDAEQPHPNPAHSPDPTQQSTSEFSEFAENVHRSRPHPTPSRHFRWFGVLLMLTLLAALGWSVWRFVLHGHVILSSTAEPDRPTANVEAHS